MWSFLQFASLPQKEASFFFVQNCLMALLKSLFLLFFRMNVKITFEFWPSPTGVICWFVEPTVSTRDAEPTPASNQKARRASLTNRRASSSPNTSFQAKESVPTIPSITRQPFLPVSHVLTFFCDRKFLGLGGVNYGLGVVVERLVCDKIPAQNLESLISEGKNSLFTILAFFDGFSLRVGKFQFKH